jgi:hypothetical protein
MINHKRPPDIPPYVSEHPLRKEIDSPDLSVSKITRKLFIKLIFDDVGFGHNYSGKNN